MAPSPRSRFPTRSSSGRVPGPGGDRRWLDVGATTAGGCGQHRRSGHRGAGARTGTTAALRPPLWQRRTRVGSGRPSRAGSAAGAGARRCRGTRVRWPCRAPRGRTSDASRVTRMLLRVAARNEPVFVRQFARRVEDETLDPSARFACSSTPWRKASRGAAWATARRACGRCGRSAHRWLPTSRSPRSSPGQQDAGDRCEQHLGWRPALRCSLARRRCPEHAWDACHTARHGPVAMGLIPCEVFSEDAWPVAMFDWLIAEKQGGEISRDVVAPLLLDRRLGAGARKSRHRSPYLVPGARRTATPTSGPRSRRRSSRRLSTLSERTPTDELRAALLAALDVGGRAIVVHDLCLARALVEPGEVAPILRGGHRGGRGDGRGRARRHPSGPSPEGHGGRRIRRYRGPRRCVPPSRGVPAGSGWGSPRAGRGRARWRSW